jgi:exosortase N
MQVISLHKTKDWIWNERQKLVLPLIVAVLAVAVLKDYFVPGIQIALGILAAPFVFRIKEPGRFSYRYAVVAVLFIAAFYFIHIKVLLFMGVGCLFLYTAESQWGRISFLPFLFLLCISPALHYAVNSFTFPIRLELSSMAAEILQWIGMDVINKGSYFILSGGQSFSVDTACIGLNMFNIGLCFVILLVGFAEQGNKKHLSVFWLGSVFLLTFGLLILTNLLRIVALVFFKSPPGTAGHELIGIASLLLYTLVPVYFLVGFLNRRFGHEAKLTLQQKPIPFSRNAVVIGVLALLTIAASWQVHSYLKDTIRDQKLNALELPGYSKELKDDGVAEFRKDNILIYIKPANKGFESDHPPAMCWQGSGFQLKDVEETNLNGYNVYTAILQRDDIVQYTAWWYDNGACKTISQWEWRFSKGEPYRIINITAGSGAERNKLCEEFLGKKLF